MTHRKINWDALGIAASVACAIHCAILPLLLTSLPLFGINIIENRQFEYLMIGIAFAVGSYSLLHGRKKHHRSYLPLAIFAAGMVFLVCKMVWHEWRHWLLVPAVACIVTAHFLNFRLCRMGNCCVKEECEH